MSEQYRGQIRIKLKNLNHIQTGKLVMTEQYRGQIRIKLKNPRTGKLDD